MSSACEIVFNRSTVETGSGAMRCTLHREVQLLLAVPAARVHIDLVLPELGYSLRESERRHVRVDGAGNLLALYTSNMAGLPLRSRRRW